MVMEPLAVAESAETHYQGMCSQEERFVCKSVFLYS